MQTTPPSTEQSRRGQARPGLFVRHRGQPHPLRHRGPFARFLRVLGPGLITGASDDDPSGIGTYSQAGAAFGFAQLWLALYLLPLVIVVQEMCGRIGLVTGKGIAGVLRAHYSRPLLYLAVALLFVANTINVGADLGAMTASVRLLAPDLPFLPLLVVLALGILLLEVFVPYRYYAKVLKVLTLSLLAYVAAGVIVQPDWASLLLKTVVPTVQLTPQFLTLVVALFGTTISPYLFFWQASEEVEEATLHHRIHHGMDAKRQELSLRKQLRALRVDTVFGLFAAAVGFWFIVMTTGSTLHAHGITDIQSADQAAAALEPLVRGFPNAGTIARTIFALGIVGTGLLAVPVLAGSAAYAIAEAFGWRQGLEQTLDHARGFYAVIALSTLVGLALNLLGVNPIAALVYSAVINGLVAVPLLVLILLVANNRAILGEHTNGRFSNVLGILTTLFMALAAIATLLTFFPGL
jgi:NRAMP (natural resistance-associated macrophage protein)-like metal ion transporter